MLVVVYDNYDWSTIDSILIIKFDGNMMKDMGTWVKSKFWHPCWYRHFSWNNWNVSMNMSYEIQTM